MSVLVKTGMDWVPLRLDFFEDERIELLYSKLGGNSIDVTMKILFKIYRNGYFVKWDENSAFLFAGRSAKDITKDFVDKVLKELIGNDYLNKRLYEEYQILTSLEIQEIYFNAIRRRKERKAINQYLLLEEDTLVDFNLEMIDIKDKESKNSLSVEDVNISPHNVNISPQNVNIRKQSRVEESRGEQSRAEEMKKEKEQTMTIPTIDEIKKEFFFQLVSAKLKASLATNSRMGGRLRARYSKHSNLGAFSEVGKRDLRSLQNRLSDFKETETDSNLDTIIESMDGCVEIEFIDDQLIDRVDLWSQDFQNHYEAWGWQVSTKKMSCWQRAVSRWISTALARVHYRVEKPTSVKKTILAFEGLPIEMKS